MCRKLCFLISFVLLLTLASTTYGIVVSDWEKTLDGWQVRETTHPIGYVYGTGATLNDYSFRVEAQTDWVQAVQLPMNNEPLKSIVLSNNRISFDLTYVPSEWPAGNDWAKLDAIVLNGQGIGWNQLNSSSSNQCIEDTLNPDYPGFWDRINFPEINTRRMTFDYSGIDFSSLPESPDYLQLIICTNAPNHDYGVWHFDNWRFYNSAYAHLPEPDDTTTNTQVDTDLIWQPGDYAQYHDIYFGTSFAEVNEANNTDPMGDDKVYRARQGVDANSYSIPEILEAGKTYYWRVDEVNEAYQPDPWKGEIWQFTTKSLKATDPTPADEATGIEIDSIVLSWAQGYYAASHDVYLGTDFNEINDVNIANLPSYPNVDFINVDVNSYEPGILQLNTTYYWRVDEVNDAHPNRLWKGDVWHFTTGNYLIVDDMESYNDLLPSDPNSNRINYTWEDGFGYGTEEYPPIVCGNGTGSLVGHESEPLAETTIVHGGGQSLPYYYVNDGSGTNNCGQQIDVYYSEAERTFDPAQDWTAEGVKALMLYFYGDPNNDANTTEQMYVKVNGVKVPYDGDMNDVREPMWHEWSIALAKVTGVDPLNITSLVIGFGDEDNTTTQGGSGLVYFDDIRLYPSRCILSKRSADFAKADYAPAGDPAGDCVIDHREIEIMARDWLVEDEVITPTEDPGSTGLVAYYPLDEGEGTTVEDASVNDHNGTLEGEGISWVSPGLMGASAIHVDGSAGSRISIGTWDPAAGTDKLTLSIWARWAGPLPPGITQPQGLICKRDGWSADGLMFTFEMDTPDAAAFRGSFSLRQYGAAETDVFSPTGTMTPFIGRWAHLAATFDGTTARLYLNGREVASGPFYFGTGTTAGMTIGNINSDSWPNCPGVFNGDLDEVRIYNRALSPAEIAYLADTSPGDSILHVPVPSPAELYEIEPQGSRKVNFRDFAVLADMWLEEQM